MKLSPYEYVSTSIPNWSDVFSVLKNGVKTSAWQKMMVASFRYNDTGLALTKGVNEGDSKLLPLWNEAALLKEYLWICLSHFLTVNDEKGTADG